MAGHGTEAAGLFSVIDLHKAFMSANGEMGAALDPGNGGDLVIVRQFAELVHAASSGIPHIHA